MNSGRRRPVLDFIVLIPEQVCSFSHLFFIVQVSSRLRLSPPIEFFHGLVSQSAFVSRALHGR